ncbi:spore cortex-lytic enzyme [Paenibacillus sp. CCS19]|uniref:cell wall hydrolase n=1 Tax=Paenibacillus sp. CCS19 TaxID=3158387 RepID=UPI00255F9DC4|nr:cell wall hydrolase [Paenibacillus cellulosilyticus]GMK41555.1 spore cortex-lytic enzyme [Paenibacillus cellulosilyticus]
MFKTKYGWLLIGFMIASLLLVLAPQPQQAKAATSYVALSVGSTGDQVADLQERLRMLGYLSSAADGKFGSGTKQAVMRFQKNAAIVQNGVAGPTTLHALHKVTVSRKNLAMLARVVYSEAGGEPFNGQIAVAAVVLNRVDSPDFPDTIEKVIFAPGAFTTVANGQYWKLPNAEAFKAAIQAAKGIDPSNGGLYFNSAPADNEWFQSRTKTASIGGHVFVK